MFYLNVIKWFFVGAVVISVLFLIPSYAAKSPKSKDKQTLAQQYLSAKEAYSLKQKQGEKLLFVDIRTPSELVFVGHPQVMDMNIPLLTLDYHAWDEAKSSYKKVPNRQFVPSIAEAIKLRKLSKNSPIVLLCRSGKRSAKAANLLVASGYSNVFTVVDGFEGDKAKTGNNKGKRVLNGWKNSHLPWSYSMDKSHSSLAFMK